jgi:hypothetical protein
MPYFYPILPAVIIILVSAHYAVNSKHKLFPAIGLAVAFGLLGYSFYLARTAPFPCGDSPPPEPEYQIAYMECVLRELAEPAIPK